MNFPIAVPAGLMLLVAGTPAAVPVSELSYDQLMSFVMFQYEDAYRDPTGHFCKFIKMSDKEDYCTVSMDYLDPELCKVEVRREFRASYKSGDVQGREFMRTRDVFLLSSLDLSQASEPEIDEAKQTSRQSFEAGIVIHRQESLQFSVVLDDKGAYRSCRVDGEDKNIPESECARMGLKPPESSKRMSLLFNRTNYKRAMAALRELQTTYCPSTGAPL